MTTPLTSSASAADEPPLYRELINVNEGYIQWAEQQPHQIDLSFTCDGTFHFYTFFALFLHALLLGNPWETPSLCSLAPEPKVSSRDPIIVKLW
uniref:Uncharacterized protein n=1 Tax=Romanomermis culicivorax TaxID=13658 RepID=A0A915KQI3_ROMCU